METKIKTTTMLLMVFLALKVQAQDQLTLADAIGITLQENHDIQIAQLDTVVSSNNATAGNAGLLPSIYAVGGYNYSENNTEIEFAAFDGSGDTQSIRADFAETEEISASVNVEYTLFDGLGGHHRLKLLKNSNKATALQTRYRIENTVLNTTFFYLNVATQQANLVIAQEQLDISNERLQRAESQFNFGAGNRTTVLNAEVAVKNDSAALRQNQLRYKTAQAELNAFMGRSPKIGFSVDEEVDFYPFIDKEQLEAKVLENNARLKLSQQGLEISESELSIAKAERYPKVLLHGGYSYFDQTNEANLLLSQQLDGWNVGVGVRLNIFDGSRVNRKIQNAQIRIDQEKLRIDQTELQVVKDFENTYTEYEQALNDLNIERSNLKTFEQNFERNQIDFRNGQITNTQLREAQLDLTSAKTRIVTATYTVKQKEAELLQLTGAMLKLE
ncbi:TolC family protein [Aquimarina celericrescens]|uniref:TolC family protein n=1 Tax=Aquimarina celericrescens TaxID=1964542 RepID=A0ABW5AVV2_9FLAO|nr:TolC family protein [Aquimarina celericrescens]